MNKRGTFVLMWLAAGTLGACGGDSTGPGPGPGGGQYYLRANIDGAWDSPTTTFVSAVLPGAFAISGSKLGGSNPYGLTIQLYNIRGPGTYPLGVSAMVPGGVASLSTTSNSWATPLSGAAGSVTITTLTSTNIAGTFTFTADGLTSATTTSRMVNNGEFNLEVRPIGPIGPVPDNAGSTLSASIAGQAWNAAAVSGNLSAQNTLTIVAQNSTRAFTISLTGVTGPGTYVVNSTTPSRSIAVSNTASQGWSTVFTGGNGTVTITSITATRIIGTFTGTLGPAAVTGATGTVTITNGTFDVGRPN